MNPFYPPRYLCRVMHRDPVRRLIFWLFVRFVLNSERYKLEKRFVGPRQRGAASTRKADATGTRYYLTDRVEEYERRERRERRRRELADQRWAERRAAQRAAS